MANRARAGALSALAGRSSEFLVMTRESMLALVRDMGKAECTEGECEIETARNIGANFVVTGDVLVLEGTFVVDLKIHESATGQLLAMESTKAKGQLEVLESLEGAAEKLVRRALGSTPETKSASALGSSRTNSAGSAAAAPQEAAPVSSRTEPRLPVGAPGALGTGRTRASPDPPKPVRPAPPASPPPTAEMVAACKALTGTHVRTWKACRFVVSGRPYEVQASKVFRLEGLSADGGAAMVSLPDGVKGAVDCSCVEGL
jgi:hypothetical protein